MFAQCGLNQSDDGRLRLGVQRDQGAGGRDGGNDCGPARPGPAAESYVPTPPRAPGSAAYAAAVIDPTGTPEPGQIKPAIPAAPTVSIIPLMSVVLTTSPLEFTVMVEPSS